MKRISRPLDTRGTILALERLYSMAQDLGIDPMLHLEEVGLLSSDEAPAGALANTRMRGLLAGFHERV
ncbi:MAG: hypothetical protein GXP25_11435 [Planctomycetes bacterium]|nr:hypothetical protein [Planctomycetota bacterium]